MPNVKKLRINGSQVDVDADEQRSLLELLREDLGLPVRNTDAAKGGAAPVPCWLTAAGPFLCDDLSNGG